MDSVTPKLNVDEYKKLMESKSTTAVKTVDKGDATSLQSVDFLTMLTTQLKYQDPMNPVNNDQFLSQMNQMTSTQTLQKMNTSLDDIKSGFSAITDAMNNSSKSMNNTSMIGLMNKTVSVLSNKLNVENAEQGVDINYTAPLATTGLTIDVCDGLGKVIKKIDVPQTSIDSEDNDYVWDGRSDTGETVADDVYTLKFTNSDGDDIEGAGIGVDGKVEGVKFSGSDASIVVNNIEYPVTKLKEIKE